MMKQAWRHEDYINGCHAHSIADIARILKVRRGDSVHDFGCGDGSDVQWLRGLGVDAEGFDLIAVSPDTIIMDMSIDKFWNKARYGVCLGMMDHIAEEKVPSTLRNIRNKVEEDIYFTIPVRDLGYNRLFGRKIQKTIKPIGWWRNRLAEIGYVKINQHDDWMTAHVKQRD